MRILKGMLSVAAAALVFGGAAVANEDLASYNAGTEMARMAPAGGGDAESLTSLRKKGMVKIGGDIELDVNVIRRSERNDDSDEFDVTEFNTSDADLNVRVDMTADAYLFLKLDLDDFQDAAVDEREFLEEVNFTWKNVRGSNFTIILGKDEMPFGMDTDKLITDPYTHGSRSDSYLGNNYANGGGVANGHNDVTQVGFANRPGEIDNVFAIQAHYAYKDLAKFELAVFQNDERDEAGVRYNGMHEDNSEDSLLLRSYAARMFLMPVEGLQLQLSFANRHLDYMDDATQAGTTDGEEDSYALSLGFDYKMASAPFEFYGEYIHGWNQGHMDEIDTDTLQLGVVWGVTEKIDLILDGEWMGMDNDTGANDIDEDLYRIAIGACYKTDYGVNFIAEYLHEWYDSDNNWEDGDADVFSFRTAYSF